MAPRRGAPAKRPAAAEAPQPVAKRPATAGPARKAAAVAKRCDEVAKAVLDASDFPAPVLEMLGSCIVGSLGVPQEKRHAFQGEIVGMVGEVLSKREGGLQEVAAAAAEKLEQVKAQKAERESAKEAAVTELGAKEEAASAAQAAAAEAAMDRAKAEEALVVTGAALAAGQEALTAAEAKRALLSATLADAYAPIKEGTAEPEKVKKGMASVMSIGKEFSFDQTLLESAPIAAAKAPGDRGSFDCVVLKQLEAEFQRCISALEETIANAEPAKKEKEASVAEAKEEVDKRKAAEQDAKAAAEAAKAAQKEALAAKRAAAKALQEWGPELKQASAAVDRASASLASFRDGPLSAYKALLEYTLVEPAEEAQPEAQEEAAPPAEAAPAE